MRSTSSMVRRTSNGGCRMRFISERPLRLGFPELPRHRGGGPAPQCTGGRCDLAQPWRPLPLLAGPRAAASACPSHKEQRSDVPPPRSFCSFAIVAIRIYGTHAPISLHKHVGCTLRRDPTDDFATKTSSRPLTNNEGGSLRRSNHFLPVHGSALFYHLGVHLMSRKLPDGRWWKVQTLMAMSPFVRWVGAGIKTGSQAHWSGGD